MKRNLISTILAGMLVLTANQLYSLTPSVVNNIETISREILDNLVKADYAAVRTNFHSTLRDQLSVQQIRDAWTNLTASVGKFKEIMTVKESTVNNYRQINIRCKFENDNATLQVTFNENEKVVGIYLIP